MPILGKVGSKFGFGSTRAKIYATGGNIVSSGDDVYHVFTSPGTFKIQERMLSRVEYFIVSGGGGGGNPGGGGGGGGGVRTGIATVTDTPGSYTITVGSGGVHTQPSAPTRSGSSSSAFSITQPGGGGGGTMGVFTLPGPQGGFGGAPGANGGGGGGAYVFCSPPNLTSASGGPGGTGPFNGGFGSPATIDGCGSPRSSGGGGGEGGAGSSGISDSLASRPGGVGVSSPSSFPIPTISPVMPAPWTTKVNASGFGYGGAGSPITASAGVTNTGGGGSGAASGGSGIIIVKYTTRR